MIITYHIKATSLVSAQTNLLLLKKDIYSEMSSSDTSRDKISNNPINDKMRSIRDFIDKSYHKKSVTRFEPSPQEDQISVSVSMSHSDPSLRCSINKDCREKSIIVTGVNNNLTSITSMLDQSSTSRTQVRDESNNSTIGDDMEDETVITSPSNYHNQQAKYENSSLKHRHRNPMSKKRLSSTDDDESGSRDAGAHHKKFRSSSSSNIKSLNDEIKYLKSKCKDLKVSNDSMKREMSSSSSSTSSSRRRKLDNIDWKDERVQECLQSASSSFKFMPRTTTKKVYHELEKIVPLKEYHKEDIRTWLKNDNDDVDHKRRFEQRKQKLAECDHACGTLPKENRKLTFAEKSQIFLFN